MTAQFVKTSSLLFVFAAAASSATAAPVAAAQHGLFPIRNANLPVDLRAALQQTLARNAASASPCARLAEPRPRDCASNAPSPLGGIDWIQQTVVGDDLVDYAMFGAAVSVDGKTALIGSPQYNPLGNAYGAGAAYVFTKTTDGWTQTQKLVAGDGTLGDNFGIAVALQGDTALIGAYKASIGANAQQGAVYVFRPLAGAWTQTQKLTPDAAAAGRMFGAWIALDGANALVSTPAGMMGDDPTTAPVYALHETDGSWNISQTLNANDYVVGDVFGFQTALNGNTAMIGAPGATIDGNSAQGAVYVFDYVDGSWTQGQKLTASDGTGMTVFGWAVALDGTTALIGAPYTNVGDNAMQGAAYVFNFDGGSWNQTQKLTAIIGEEDTRYGLAVALSGNTAVVASAWTSAVEGVPSYGGAWVYTATAEDGFVPQSVLLSPTSEVTTFGFAAAMSAGTLLLSSPIEGGTNDIGYAAFYTQDRVFTNGFDGATP